MTVSDFEDPRALLLCIQSDCERPRAGGTPFCAAHLREQETRSPGIVEPDIEARVARVRTEDDDHPGMVKVYDRETGEPSWVPAEPARLYVGPDPDTVDISALKFSGASLPMSTALLNEARSLRNGPRESGSPPEYDSGVWVAATTTRVVIFDNELGALRYAVANQANVEFVPFGVEHEIPRSP